MTYRTALITVNSDISAQQLDTLISLILKDCNAVGVSYTISKQKVFSIHLTNTLVGDRVYYYTVDIKDQQYSIRTVKVDLPAGEMLSYGVNMFQSKESAELAAKKALEALS